MKKTIIILVLVALAVAPLAAFEVKGVGLDFSFQSFGFPVQANVTFEFSERSTATASLGYTVSGMTEDSQIPSASLAYRFKAIDGLLDLNIGAVLLDQLCFHSAETINSLIAAVSVGTSFDFSIGGQSFTAYIDAYWGPYLVNTTFELMPFPSGIVGLTYNF